MKHGKFKVAVVIKGRTYTTARAAAFEYAEAITMKQYDRMTKKLGYSAYHLQGWDERNMRAAAVGFRRLLPIFQKVMGP